MTTKQTTEKITGPILNKGLILTAESIEQHPATPLPHLSSETLLHRILSTHQQEDIVALCSRTDQNSIDCQIRFFNVGFPCHDRAFLDLLNIILRNTTTSLFSTFQHKLSAFSFLIKTNTLHVPSITALSTPTQPLAERGKKREAEEAPVQSSQSCAASTLSDVVSAVIERLADEDDDVQLNALDTLGSLKHTILSLPHETQLEILQKVTKMFFDESAWVQNTALKALGVLSDLIPQQPLHLQEHIVCLVLKKTSGKDSWVICAALGTLVKLSSTILQHTPEIQISTINQVTAMLDTPNREVLLMTLHTLARFNEMILKQTAVQASIINALFKKLLTTSEKYTFELQLNLLALFAIKNSDFYDQIKKHPLILHDNLAPLRTFFDLEASCRLDIESPSSPAISSNHLSENTGAGGGRVVSTSSGGATCYPDTLFSTSTRAVDEQSKQATVSPP